MSESIDKLIEDLDTGRLQARWHAAEALGDLGDALAAAAEVLGFLSGDTLLRAASNDLLAEREELLRGAEGSSGRESQEELLRATGELPGEERKDPFWRRIFRL